jgi:hypothetical protein
MKLNECWRREFGEDHRFLKEHIEYGLPTLYDIEQILNGRNHELFFVGDIRLAACLFRNQMRALGHGELLFRRLHGYLSVFSTIAFCFLRITNVPNKFTNRVYVHIKKVGF